MHAFTRLSLSRQFLIASFPIVLIGMIGIGWWVGATIERGVANRIGAITSLYVDSFIAPHLQQLEHGNSLGAAPRAALDRLLTDTPLGQKIVAFKIWDQTGRVLYSPNAALIGRTFPIDEGLSAAFQGNVRSEISDLTQGENEFESRRWSRLIETYSPIRADQLGSVIAVAEFYQTTDELARETREAQIRSWLVVAGTMSFMYLLIFGLVHRGSETIDGQRRQLSAKVAELSAVVTQNAQLHDKVRRAALRTSSLNERFLRRISADLHDGPGQDLALGLMRFESVAEACRDCATCNAPGRPVQDDFQTVRIALKSAFSDLRSISMGLQLPEIDQLGSSQIAGRAVRDFERKTGATVRLATSCDSSELPLPVKIALYRLIQESLANGFRHGGGSDLSVELACNGSWLDVTISDKGTGFDPLKVDSKSHFGLEGMRERVEILGGSFQVQTAPGHGTVVRASLPKQLAGFEE
ncbi:MAG TPA: sensor histidine kinase [Ramlibacter sp.]|nr:sensor histidine kinase [Ramlibacter sp.]